MVLNAWFVLDTLAKNFKRSFKRENQLSEPRICRDANSGEVLGTQEPPSQHCFRGQGTPEPAWGHREPSPLQTCCHLLVSPLLQHHIFLQKLLSSHKIQEQPFLVAGGGKLFWGRQDTWVTAQVYTDFPRAHHPPQTLVAPWGSSPASASTVPSSPLSPPNPIDGNILKTSLKGENFLIDRCCANYPEIHCRSRGRL